MVEKGCPSALAEDIIGDKINTVDSNLLKRKILSD